MRPIEIPPVLRLRMSSISRMMSALKATDDGYVPMTTIALNPNVPSLGTKRKPEAVAPGVGPADTVEVGTPGVPGPSRRMFHQNPPPKP